MDGSRKVSLQLDIKGHREEEVLLELGTVGVRLPDSLREGT